MNDDAKSWTGMGEIDLEFAQTAFSSRYDVRRAANLATQDRALLDGYYTTQNQQFLGRSRILEFGCELTGGSDWLADAGPLCVTDITAEVLLGSADRLKNIGCGNIPMGLLRHGKDIKALPPCDLFYSALSINRVPPTVLAHVLSLLLAKVTVGGVALLHVPTQHRHYQLLLQDAQELDDVHVIPQWKLFELLESLGFSLVLVQEDSCFRASDIVYHTILAQRRA